MEGKLDSSFVKVPSSGQYGGREHFGGQVGKELSLYSYFFQKFSLLGLSQWLNFVVSFVLFRQVPFGGLSRRVAHIAKVDQD